MKTRNVSASALLALLLVAGTGCETHRWATRDGQDLKTGNENADSSKAIGGDATSGANPFFKNNRPSGGWSSEARDIERNLGVGG